MALNMDNCEHGFPQFLCRRCDGNDRSGQGENSSPAGPANLANNGQIKIAEDRIGDTIAAAEEVLDRLDGLVGKTTEKVTSARQQHTLTVLPSEHMEAGKGGEGGVFRITNAEFIAAVFADLPEGASAAVCTKPGNPKSRWMGSPTRRSSAHDCC